MVLQATVKKQSSRQWFPLKVTVQKSIWTIISNQMIKHQLLHTRFDQITDDKHDIYLYGKLSTKLLLQVVNKNTKLMFTKTGRFFSNMVVEVTVRKKLQTSTSVGWKGNYPETRSTEIFKTSSLDGCDFRQNNCDTQCIKVDGCFLLLLKNSRSIQISFSCLLDQHDHLQKSRISLRTRTTIWFKMVASTVYILVFCRTIGIAAACRGAMKRSARHSPRRYSGHYLYYIAKALHEAS